MECEEERKTEENPLTVSSSVARGPAPEFIDLNTMGDLQKLSFLEIKNLPLGKLRGDVFEAALKQAIELEK